MSSKLTDPRPYEQYLLTLALLIICSLLIYAQAAKRLDLLTYDIAINVAPAPIDPNTVIIAIDEKSLNGIGQWPWRRGIHAQLIDKLTEYNASLIAFDIIFSERAAIYPEDDAVLARAIKNNGHVILPLHINPLSHGNTLSEILPIPELVKSSQSLGHVHVDIDEDGLARGLYLNSGVGNAFWPSLSMAMASEINPMIQYVREVENLKTAPYMSVKTQYRLIPFAGPGGTFPTYSYLDVMLDNIPAETFRDKTVLIGANASGLGDIIPTPVSKSATPMSGVELHANAYSALMTNTTIRPVSSTWGYLLTFAFIMIPILLFPRLKPTYVMPSTALLVCFVFAFSYLLIAYDHTWFPPINSVIGILIAYPLWSWQRMRHLNSFLNHELSRLTKQQNIDVRKLDQHPIEEV
ncbi:MAG: CHASE2 domain-containing sensor protein, partial [Pseudohongiellaceae bacterium]